MSGIVLASTSPYRRALLERLGLAFSAQAPDCDEEALKDPRLRPQELAEHLAAAKARSLVGQHPQAIIIGSDQLVDLDGEILGKPGSASAAVAQLERMSGRSHRLITAMALYQGDRLHRHTDITVLHMRCLQRAELERSVAADAPLDCAGSYKLERQGIALFERIESADHSAITGLPLIALCSLLRSLGVAIP
jgi:septum formation protein